MNFISYCKGFKIKEIPIIFTDRTVGESKCQKNYFGSYLYGSISQNKKNVWITLNLSIIIVSYNVKNYLRQCINSIYSSKNINNFEVIVIDNHSFDDSSLMIKDKFPDVKLIQNCKNLGFSKAINQGIKLATGKYLCFLNPDTLIQNDTFSKLTNYMESDSSIGCIGPKIINANGLFKNHVREVFHLLWLLYQNYSD